MMATTPTMPNRQAKEKMPTMPTTIPAMASPEDLEVGLRGWSGAVNWG
jgi:hypothetical protein